VRSIVEHQKDNVFVPNRSLGLFCFEQNINQYLSLYPYYYEENPNKEEGYGFDSYDFYTLGMSVWTTSEGIIKSIKCDEYCYWHDVNIIGLQYKKFKEMFNIKPDNEEICYMLSGHMKSQHVYEFDSIGLQLWTWYGKIRTVIACRLPDD